MHGPVHWVVQYRVAIWVTGRQPLRFMDVGCYYPLLDTAIQEAGFEEVEACVLRSQNTAAQYILMRPILDLCEETVHIQGMWVVKSCREQEVLDLVGVFEAKEALEDEVGAEETEG